MAKIKLIEVGGTSCGLCKMMKPMVDKAVSQFSPDELDFSYVYGDTDEGKAIMSENKIENVNKVPSFFFIKDGEILETFNGGIALPALVQKIKSYL